MIIDNVYIRKRGRLIIWWESARNRGLDDEGDKKETVVELKLPEDSTLNPDHVDKIASFSKNSKTAEPNPPT